jgi:hypothetical protein
MSIVDNKNTKAAINRRTPKVENSNQPAIA